LESEGWNETGKLGWEVKLGSSANSVRVSLMKSAQCAVYPPLILLENQVDIFNLK
jgi:hypothetical protein